MANWLEDILLGVKGWVSPAAELVTNDGAAHVLASYAEPASQKTASYRVHVVADETPVNNDAAGFLLFLTVKNVGGVFSEVHATISDGAGTGGLVASIAHNNTTHAVEVSVTGIADRFFKWRCVRLETAP